MGCLVHLLDFPTAFDADRLLLKRESAHLVEDFKKDSQAVITNKYLSHIHKSEADMETKGGGGERKRVMTKGTKE